MHYYWSLVKAGYVFFLGNYHLRCLLTCEEGNVGKYLCYGLHFISSNANGTIKVMFHCKMFVISKQIGCYDLLISTKVSRRRRRGNM